MILRQIKKGGCFNSWINTTRIEHPDSDSIGYNTEENRIEFYIKSLDQWFYLWSEFIAVTEVPSQPYFIETFESDWFVNNIFNLLLSETFESDWFVNNIFNLLLSETFEIGW